MLEERLDRLTGSRKRLAPGGQGTGDVMLDVIEHQIDRKLKSRETSGSTRVKLLTRNINMPKTGTKRAGLTFQDLLLKLEHYWTRRDCILQQPYDVEVGAGTMHPETFLRVLGPEPYRVVYAQPSRRPTDGRYGENPNRLYKHTQLQVILKPSPANIQDLYLESLASVGINLKEHDVRFEEDNWESPTLGAWGIGWQVLLDGLEITQFTYFQQCGGIDLDPVSVELTYGLDRIAAYLQGVDNVFDVRWSATMTYGQVRLAEEQQFSAYSFDYADAVVHAETIRLKRGRGGASAFQMECGKQERCNRNQTVSRPRSLRPLLEVLASFQSARRARGNFSHRARRNDWPRAQACNASGARVARPAAAVQLPPEQSREAQSEIQ